jgi:hypothetical protein
MTKRMLNFVPFINSWCFSANKPAIEIIAKGKPSHFFRMSSQATVRYDGHPSSEPNILFWNSFLEFSKLRGRNL